MRFFGRCLISLLAVLLLSRGLSEGATRAHERIDERSEEVRPDGGFERIGVDEDRGTSRFSPVRTEEGRRAPSFRFTRFVVQAEEGETVTVNVEALGLADGEEGTVTVSVRDNSTATNGTDVTGFNSPQSFTFSGGDPAPRTLTFETVDDGKPEGVERLEVTLSSMDGDVVEPGTFTLWVLDNPSAQGPIAAGDSGQTLLDSLQRAYGDPPTLGYGSARDSMYRRIYNEGGTVEGFYSGFQVSVDPQGGDASDQALRQGVNTEHVWPRAEGAENEPALSNLHILVPARDVVNSARSNYAFGEIPDAEADEWFFEDQTQSTAPPRGERAVWSELDDSPGNRDDRRFETRHSVKGNVARAVFYFAMAYPNRADFNFLEEQKQTLYKWHLIDPVDAREMRRHLRQASYQGNKLNPFVVDSTLIERAFIDELRVSPPTSLTATEEAASLRLSWDSPLVTVQGYNVYRARSSLTDPTEATRLTSTPIADTQYVDTDVQPGAKYVYAVTAIGPDGEETPLSNRTSARLYPDTVAAEIRRPFDGPRESDQYRLVALPGQVDRGVSTTLSGNAGDAWQAYWDDGSEEDFLVPFNGTQQFFFRPGRGLWLLADSTWSVDVTAETVSLDSASTTTIPLHDGWNIISNPFDIDVEWNAVDAANDGTLQSLWAWDGSYSAASTFASARTGTAYYFYNDQGLDALQVPYAPASSAQAKAPDAPMVTLAARVGSTRTSAVRVGARPEARDSRDEYDQVAPPGRFGEAALRLRAPGEQTGRSGALAREWRAPSATGHTFDLVLDAEPGSTVELRAGDIKALGAEAALVDTRTARRYDLSGGGAVQLQPEREETSLRLIVGSAAYVDGAADRVRPDEVLLRAPFPNPVRDRATVSYALPEPASVQLAVYDVLGRRVAVLDEGRREAGVHRLTWEAGNAASGVYLLRLSADGQRRTREVMHVR